jgi:homoserine dehydrogenase
VSRVRFAIAGVGNVGWRFLQIAHERVDFLRDRGLELVCVGAADSSGALIDPRGLPMRALFKTKSARRPLSSLGTTVPVDQLVETELDLLLDATPTDLRTGEPGLSLMRRALDRGIPTVTANKGPLVVAYDELAEKSELRSAGRPALRFSGSVCGGMPTVNFLRRDLAAVRVLKLEGIFNQTSQIILGRMGEGLDFEDALHEAQELGVAEPDPSLDVDGFDAANKLVIIANAALGQPTKLSDVEVFGVRSVTPELIAQARASGGQVSLVASAIPDGGHFRLEVGPRVLGVDHPLGRIGVSSMGLTVETDTCGRLTMISQGEGAGGASAAMLRDVIEIFASR